MENDIPVNEAGIDEVTEPDLEPVDPQKVADMDAEYQVLLRAYLNASDGMNPAVAIAALFSALGTIAVQALGDESQCRRYIAKCAHDVLLRLPEAFKAKALQQKEATRA